MVDYANLLSVAQRLITENGRTVSLIKYDRTIDNSATPWRGTSTPRAAPALEKSVNAVFVPPSGVSKLGFFSDSSNELFKRSDKIFIVAGDDILSDYEALIDSDNVEYRITTMETLHPADTILLYFIGVKR